MKTRTACFLISIFGLMALSSCGAVKLIDDASGDQPWVSYRSMDDYIETICPGFFSGTAARGVSTINGSTTPLLMLNGQEVSSYDDVNLYDVVSVEIITDSRVAAYGVRGANGVALVTTKGSQNANKMYKDRN